MFGAETKGAPFQDFLLLSAVLRVRVRRPHSTKQKVVQGKCPLHSVRFSGVVCSNTLLPNTSVLTHYLSFRANSTCEDSRTPRLVEHFWVPPLGASCSNKLFVGTLRPSHRGRFQNPRQNPVRTKLRLKYFPRR